MSHHGDIRLGDTIDVKFTTAVGGTPTTLSGGTVAAYIGNSTTELTAGITLTTDFDSRTGMHNVRVVASSGNGYATATNVILVLTAGTVGGVSVVGYVVGSFSIEARSAVMPTTAGRTLDVSTGGEAGVDWANVGSPTTTVDLSGTTIGVVTALAAGAIAAASIAANAITAAKIAADAIGASQLATDAVTEIWAKVIETNGSITAQQGMSLILAAVAGVTTDLGATLKDPSGTTTRISATINNFQERTAMTVTPSA